MKVISAFLVHNCVQYTIELVKYAKNVIF